MIARKVRFTKTARRHLQEVTKWWRENREDTQVLVEGLEEAIYVIARLPGVGSPYLDSPVQGLRRIYLRRLGSHLYYTFTDEAVIVRALWHGKRGSGPLDLG